jgi:hypothetical protein
VLRQFCLIPSEVTILSNRRERAEKFNAMTTGSNRHKKAKGREPLVVKASLVVLGAVVFICAGLLASPEVWQFRPNGQECSTKDAAARQTCYEELNARAPRPSIKGLNALPIPGPSGQGE